MKILEALFIKEFCDRTDSRIFLIKKTIYGKSIWQIVPNKNSEIGRAEIEATDNELICRFSKDGRKVETRFGLDLSLLHMSTGAWEENQAEDRDIFEEKIKNYFPDKDSWSSD